MSTFEDIQPAKKKKGSSELWLISYADLVTNMMAFFIMLIAISKVDISKFDAVASKASHQVKDDLQSLKAKLDAQIKDKKLETAVKTDLGMNGLTLEFVNGVMFQSASSEMSQFALKDAKPLMNILKNIDDKYIMSFEGYTDDLPIKSSQFKDNWGLSTARGVAMLEIMKEMGVPPARMSVAGYADTRPKISISGKTGKSLEAARAANRRVVIRVHQ